MPVNTPFLKYFKVSFIETHTTFAYLLKNLFALPGTLFCSCKTTGIFSLCAAKTTGTVTYPPTPTTTSGSVSYTHLRAHETL